MSKKKLRRLILKAIKNRCDVARCVLSKRRNDTYFGRVKYIDSQGKEHKVTEDLSDDQVDRIFSRVKREYNWAIRQKMIIEEAAKGQRDIARCVLSKRRNGTYFYRVKYIDSKGEVYEVTVDLSDDQINRIFAWVKHEYNRVRAQRRKRLRRMISEAAEG